VQFPSRDRLLQIIQSRFSNTSEALVSQAVHRFLQLRDDMRKDKGEMGKQVSTSELIDWFQVLRRYPEDEALAKLQGKLPHLGVLLKRWEDHQWYLKQQGKQ